MATERVTITLPDDLAEQVRIQAAGGGVSGWIATAVAHELEHQHLAELDENLEAEFGPPDPGLLAEFEALMDQVEAAQRARAWLRRPAG
ncbi:MAG: hypothetical protein ACRDZQ_03100 [Acidimicrobiales bacterium]